MRLRLGTWNPAYGLPVTGPPEQQLQVPSEVELGVEPPWTVRGQAEVWDGSVILIDGRERFEGLVYLEDEQPALLASFAVGAVSIASPGARYVEESFVCKRFLLTLGPNPASGKRLELAQDLSFEIREVLRTDSGLADLQGKLRELRRLMETRTGRKLAESEPEALVVHDGPLYLDPDDSTRRMGYSKTQYRAYLPPAEAVLLATLAPGERTPLFRIVKGRRRPVYSWYLRLPLLPASTFAPSAALVRVETGLSRDDALAMAAWSLELLPRLSSQPFRDPRAPQNLVPIGALERELGRRLGRRDTIRGRLVRYMGGEV